MTDSFVQLAQSSGNGFEWSDLLWLLIFIVIPILNGIKDRYTQALEGKKGKQASTAGDRKPRVPSLRPVEPQLPTAKPLYGSKGFHVKVAPPPDRSVTPPVTEAPMVAELDESPAPPPIPPARPAVPRPAPRPQKRVEHRRPPKPVARPVEQKRPVRREAAPAPTRRPRSDHARRGERHAVAGVYVDQVAPAVNLHEVDPMVALRETDPHVQVRGTGPLVNVHDLADTEAPAEGPLTAGNVLGGAVSVRDLRRAVILSEIFRPPLALRQPGLQPGLSL